MRPYSPLELAGRDIYIREGCYVCHSQMIRPFLRRGRALRPLLAGRRVDVRPPVPVGLEADRPRSRAGSATATRTTGMSSICEEPRSVVRNRSCRATPSSRSKTPSRHPQLLDPPRRQRAVSACPIRTTMIADARTRTSARRPIPNADTVGAAGRAIRRSRSAISTATRRP